MPEATKPETMEVPILNEQTVYAVCGSKNDESITIHKLVAKHTYVSGVPPEAVINVRCHLQEADSMITCSIESLYLSIDDAFDAVKVKMTKD
jgi:hypothetical protein